MIKIISIFTLLLASSSAFASLNGYCTGIPMLANNTDVSDWDGRSTFNMKSNGSIPSEYSATLDMGESEGEAVPTLSIHVNQGYRVSADSIHIAAKGVDGKLIASASSDVPSSEIANEYGFNIGISFNLDGKYWSISCRIDPSDKF